MIWYIAPFPKCFCDGILTAPQKRLYRLIHEAWLNRLTAELSFSGGLFWHQTRISLLNVCTVLQARYVRELNGKGPGMHMLKSLFPAVLLTATFPSSLNLSLSLYLSFLRLQLHDKFEQLKRMHQEEKRKVEEKRRDLEEEMNAFNRKKVAAETLSLSQPLKKDKDKKK